MIDTIEKNADTISIVWFSMVNYLTSTKFNVEKIVKACHKYEIKCCVDLAHAAGSIPV
jgi:kynureninase